MTSGIIPSGLPNLASALVGTGPGGNESAGTYYNVLNHGIVSSNVLVQSGAIQALYDYVSTQGGGTIYFPAGIYVCSGIASYTNITTLGDGPGATTLFMDGTTVATDTWLMRSCASGTACSNVWLKQLTFDGNKDAWGNGSNQRNIGYYLAGVDNIHGPNNAADCGIVEVEFKNCKTYGCDVEAHDTGFVPRVLIIGGSCHDNGYTTGAGLNNTADGYTLIGSDITVIGAQSYNNAANGYNIGQVARVFERVKLIGCDATTNGKGGFLYHDGLFNSINIGSTSVGNGVATTSTGGYGFAANTGSARIIHIGCIAEGNWVQGFRNDDAVGCITIGCVSDDNSLLSAATNEMYMTASATNSVMIGNVVNAVTATHAIAEQNSTSGNNTVIGNQLLGGDLGIQGTGSVFVNNKPYQPRNHSVTQPAMPATTVAATLAANTGDQNCMVVCTAGTGGLSVQIGGITALVLAALGVGTVIVPAGASITPVYPSGAPTWTWFGL